MRPSTICEAIGLFTRALQTQFNADLVALWSPGMETQINVSPEGGEPVHGKPGRYINDTDEWGPIRIPRNARTDPQFHDYPAPWLLDKHASDIGMSGWNWKERKSYWVSIDVDDILKHLGTGVTKEEIGQLIAALERLDYVMIRRGTSGMESNGIHIYVFVDGITTKNHDEHAALAQAVVAKLAEDTGLPLQTSIDVAGRIMWFWSTRASEEIRSYECLKEMTRFLIEADLLGWRDYIRVQNKQEETSTNIYSSFSAVEKTTQHDRFLEEYKKNGWPFEYRPEHNCYHMHRAGIKETADTMGLPPFPTSSPGTDKTKANCAVYNRRRGFYVVCFVGTKEGPEWGTTAKGNSSIEYSFVSRPTITIDDDLDGAVEESIKALRNDPNTYQRDALVEIATDAKKPRLCLADNGSPQLRVISAATMKRKLSACAAFQRWNSSARSCVPCLPSDAIVNAVLSSAEYPGIPVATGIVSCPILRADGSIAREPGYDSSTGLYLNIHGDYPDLMDPDIAVERLKGVLVDFPYATGAHLSGWCAALVTLLARAAFPGPAPFFLFDANMSGAGKGLQTDAITMIVERKRAARYAFPKDRDELRKAITSVTLSGAQYLLFDNIKGKFGGATIENAMTAGRWSDRILGINRQVDLPLDLIWLGTANNATLTSDMVRRTCHIRLETTCERPDLRTGFTHPDLLDYVKTHRRDLAIAALSIPAMYLAADRPKQDVPPWGGFEGWSDLVRSSLVWAGLPDPDTREKLAAQADDDTEQLRCLMDGWEELGGEATVAEAINIAGRGTAPTLDLVLTEMPRNDRNGTLGRLLRDYRGRVLGGKRFDRTEHKIPRWRLVYVEAIPQEVGASPPEIPTMSLDDGSPTAETSRILAP